ncbi:MAG TPA: family 16 glycoside hydrolase, partial [Bryobacteraceae bacterium]|nr:family 16 glycoside hydrolase [Bryobacteraceae bacterium]
ASWKAADGQLAADGPRSHLFYTGPVQNAVFKNFELEVEAMARPGCNSGVYFHTKYQEKGFPIQGFEIQINNTFGGEGSYRERKKTGSLYGIRNVYMQLIPDNQWFKIHAAVRGKNIQIRLNDVLVVDYTEPTPPIIPPAEETGRFLSQGAFALQCHNEGSKAFFRRVRVRPLPDDLATPGPVPVVDAVFKQIINIGRHNLPMVDYHVKLGRGLTLEQALAKSRRDGIQYGIVLRADAAGRTAAEGLKGQPVFVGTDVTRPGQPRFGDYAVTSVPALLEAEPVDIFSIAQEHEPSDELIALAAKKGVAIEINDRLSRPGPAVIRAAKAAGCKFAFGTGNTGPEDLRRSEYGLRMVEECRLGWQDFFLPKPRNLTA